MFLSDIPEGTPFTPAVYDGTQPVYVKGKGDSVFHYKGGVVGELVCKDHVYIPGMDNADIEFVMLDQTCFSPIQLPESELKKSGDHCCGQCCCGRSEG